MKKADNRKNISLNFVSYDGETIFLWANTIIELCLVGYTISKGICKLLLYMKIMCPTVNALHWGKHLLDSIKIYELIITTVRF